jgi:hypothetical protein
VGGNDALGGGRPRFISLSVIDLLLCDASKSAAFGGEKGRVEELVDETI